MQVGDLSVSIEIVGNADDVMAELRRATALGLKVESARMGVRRQGASGIYISPVEDGNGDAARRSVQQVLAMLPHETSTELERIIGELERSSR